MNKIEWNEQQKKKMMQIHFIDNGLGSEWSSHLVVKQMKKKEHRTLTHIAITVTFLEHSARAKQNEWVFHERMSDSKLLTAQFIERCVFVVVFFSHCYL